MKSKIFIFMFSFQVIQSIFFPSYSQVKDSLVNIIYLKDGTDVKGTVIETEPGKTITIRTSKGIIYKYDFKNDIEDMELEVHKVKIPTPVNGSSRYNGDKVLEVVESNSPINTSWYFSFGTGIPQILKFEFGLIINIHNWGLGLAANFGAMYFKPIEMNMLREMMGFSLKLHFPKIDLNLTPYISVEGAAAFMQLNFWGQSSKPPSSSQYYLGAFIPLESWLQVCPEIGIVKSNVSNYRSVGFNINLQLIF